MTNKLPEKSIGATAIRIARRDVAIEQRVEEDSNGKVIGTRVGHVTGLRRYRAHRDITLRQFEAGRRILDDHARATRTLSGASTLDSTRAGGDPHTAMMRAIVERRTAQGRYKRAIEVLPGVCSSIIMWVVILDRPTGDWTQPGYHRREGMSVLKVSLDALGDHYRLDNEGRTPGQRKARLLGS